MIDLESTLIENDIDTSSLEPLVELETAAIFTLQTPREQSLKLWQTLRSMVVRTGYYPVILGGHNERACTAEPFQDVPYVPEELISEAESINAVEWLKARWGEFVGDEEDVGEEDSPAPTRTIMLPQFLEDDEFFIALLPTTESWHVPALLLVGDSGRNPFPAYHSAVHRHWQTLYGTQIVVANCDTIELLVSKPPDSDAAARLLAREQLAYCQGDVQSAEALVPTLRESLTWYFWWE